MCKDNKGIIFDNHFSNALIKSASKNGYIRFDEDSESDKNLVKSFKTNREYSLLEQKCLELCLLYEEVYLNDPFQLAMLDKLQNEGIVKQYRCLDDDKVQVDDRFNEITLGEDIKPLIIKYLIKHFKKRLPFLKETRGFANKYVDGLYDFIILWRAGLQDEAVRHTHLPLNEILKIQGDPVDYISDLFTELDRSDSLHGFAVDMIDIDFEISSIISLMKMSKEFRLPFISNRISDSKNNLESEKTHEVYKTCLIEMKNEIQYIPQVDSMEDVLRLRERSEIIRFREVLNEWKNLLNIGEFNLAEKMRIDISKSNKEILKLDKWRKVDKWLYYLSVPTMFIPYVSNIVTIGSTYTRYHIERKEKYHGWIGIGR